MSTQSIESSKVGRCVITLLAVSGLLLANSLLLYFVIWDLLSPSEPYTVILFFLSGAGQLGYCFLPWFARELLGPVFRRPGNGSQRFSAPANPSNSGFPVTVLTHFGAALCLSAIGLWFLQADLFQPEEQVAAYITEANCQQIGGAPVRREGRLVCVLEDRNEPVATSRVAAATGF